MGLRDLARRVKNAVKDRVRDTGMPSSPPDPRTPPPAPKAAVSSAPREEKSSGGSDAEEDTPWYMQGDDDLDGWENTDAQDED